MKILNPDKDVIWEKYNPPLIRWIVNDECQIERILILQKQIKAGELFPTFTCKDKNLNKYTTSIHNIWTTGFATQKEAWDYQLENIEIDMAAIQTDLDDLNDKANGARRLKDIVLSELNKIQISANS